MKIDKNIPIPTSYATLVDEMEIGDSVTVEGVSARNTVYQTMVRKGYKAVSRRVTDQGYSVYRIWRAK